jgi:hypothetical protein
LPAEEKLGYAAFLGPFHLAKGPDGANRVAQSTGRVPADPNSVVVVPTGAADIASGDQVSRHTVGRLPAGKGESSDVFA